jgi:uncharacterized membrane protein YozB (DUF420 family)
MDAKLAFWTAALANMGVIVVLALLGVRQRRAGDVGRHRRSMLTGTWLVGLFLVSYGLKVLFLGREDMSVWSSAAVWVLRFHEGCVAVLIVAGSLAVRRGLRLGRTRNASRDPADAPAPPQLARGHRLVGWTAVVAATAGLFSAALVLLGMYERAGLL